MEQQIKIDKSLGETLEALLERIKELKNERDICFLLDNFQPQQIKMAKFWNDLIEKRPFNFYIEFNESYTKLRRLKDINQISKK